jgi:predicted  nucleic acid-binding Zn-ribbon protein
MAKKRSHSPETDLDKTDQLPILDSTQFDQDVEDDAVPPDQTVVLPGPPLDFVRPSGVDLPSLAESVRSVEQRISRQNAEFESLTRAYERARDAESALGQRANALAVDLAAARTELESEQARSRELDRVLSDRSGSIEIARAQANALASELQASCETVTALNLELKRGESAVNATRSELGAAKTQASSYLDLLRTRDWRRGFDLNMFREFDAQLGAAHAGHRALESERDRLQGQVAAVEAQLTAQLAAAQTERTRLTAQLAARDRAVAEAREQGSGDSQRITELLEASQLRQAEQAAQIAQLRGEQAAQIERLQSEAETHEQEVAVLMAHLQEARRPIQSIEADVKRLTEELAAKTFALEEIGGENSKLRASLERTRGALEEREFLIRRLERSESNNANVLGRIQTSIERLGSASVGASTGAAAGPTADWSAELIRIDGEQPVTHVLSRRARIGRAAGCELQIDSGSVSRQHALVLVGPRNAIIEDLNSTNGVLVNGRKVNRQVLSDGDLVTIGETEFRYVARSLNRSPEPDPAETTPKT